MLRDRALLWVVGIVAVLTVIAVPPGTWGSGNVGAFAGTVVALGINLVIFGGLFVLLRAGYRRMRPSRA